MIDEKKLIKCLEKKNSECVQTSEKIHDKKTTWYEYIMQRFTKGK